MMYLHQNQNVQRVQLLSHLACILMIYLPPAEVFHVLRCLCDSSGKILNNRMRNMQQVQLLRWHIPQNSEDHAQLIATFIDYYIRIKKTYGSKRQILEKCFQLEFNFDLLIHSMLNSLCMNLVPIEYATHISMIYLLEG